jgi:nicotinamide riboside transporter PnuC
MIDFTWLITIASIVGTVANIYKRQWCFIIWLVTNSAWMIVDFCMGMYSQAALFAVYVGLAMWGLIQWRRKK